MDMKYKINVNLYDKEVDLFVSTQFGYSINSFNFDQKVEIPDKVSFMTLANTIGMIPDELELKIYKSINKKIELYS
jgi:hypothetical protein